MTTIKIGWGTRIILLYLAFVVLIVTLVTKSMHQTFDLVSGDYYNQELRYQDVIDASKNQAELSAPVRLYQDGKQLFIQLPKEFQNIPVHGEVVFYSEVNAACDRTFPLHTNDVTYQLAISELAATKHYLVKLRWRAGSKSYYQETPFNIKP